MMVSLPWPDKRLSPNARTHWAILAKVKKLARADAHTLATIAIPLRDKRAIAAVEGRIPIVVRFYPPDARLRDDDNAIASFKAARDGLADALGIDDRRFLPTYQFMEPEKPGRVEVVIHRSAQSDAFCSSTANRQPVQEKAADEGSNDPRARLIDNAAKERRT